MPGRCRAAVCGTCVNGIVTEPVQHGRNRSLRFVVVASCGERTAGDHPCGDLYTGGPLLTDRTMKTVHDSSNVSWAPAISAGIPHVCSLAGHHIDPCAQPLSVRTSYGMGYPHHAYA